MQPDSSQPQEAPVPAPVPMIYAPPPRKPRSYLVLSIVLGVFMIFFCLTAAGLGYWANTLNTDLAGKTQELADLQAKYDSLETDNATLRSDMQSNIEKLNADIAALQADLDTTKQELATSQTDAQSARENGEKLQAKIDAALIRMDVVLGIFVDFKNEKGVERDIRETGDEEMLALFQAAVDVENPNSQESLEKWFDFLAYLFESIVEELQ